MTLWLCVAPLRLGGLRGKKSTPSVWLGGTGELVEVGKQKREQRRAGAAWSAGAICGERKATVWVFLIW